MSLMLYCKDGIVLATHDSEQNIPASAYGAGAYAVPGTGWTGKIFDPAPPIDANTLVYYATAKRAALGAGGYTTTAAGAQHTFETDATSLGDIAGKQLRLAQPSPPATIAWYFADAGFVTISAADFTAAAIKIADFIQATYDTLKTVIAGISGGTITDFAEIDAAAWPTNAG